MDDLISSQSDESDGRGDRETRRNKRQHRRAGRVFDQQQCLAALSSLLGLVASRFITPAQSNAMRGALEAILRHHQHEYSARCESAPQQVDIMSILRANPSLASLLEPLLTDEQLAEFMRETMDGHDEQN